MITLKKILNVSKTLGQMQFTKPNTNKMMASLNQLNYFNFAFMSLFENNKTPAELSPVFKRQTKFKGHLKNKKSKAVQSTKLNPKVR